MSALTLDRGTHIRFKFMVGDVVRSLRAETLRHRYQRSSWVLCRLEDGDRQRLLLDDVHRLDREGFDRLDNVEKSTGKWTLDTGE